MRTNSSMLPLSADLESTGSVFVGFDAEAQRTVLASIDDLG